MKKRKKMTRTMKKKMKMTMNVCSSAFLPSFGSIALLESDREAFDSSRALSLGR
jgi:hypothetical protein